MPFYKKIMMKKNIFISITIGFILVVGFFVVKESEKSVGTSSEVLSSSSVGPTVTPQISAAPADKIEVIHFHGTHQCWSCITVGEYALKTIKEKFTEEYKNGTIVFRDINGELPENKDMVIKYQARGSSLFENAITAGKDNIEEDITVWRLVSDENQFISYFQNKLNKLLGK